jgi:hypothetical protein
MRPQPAPATQCLSLVHIDRHRGNNDRENTIELKHRGSSRQANEDRLREAADAPVNSVSMTSQADHASHRQRLKNMRSTPT